MLMTMMAATLALKATAQAFAKDGRDPHAHIQSVAVIEVEALTPTAQSEVYATAAQADFWPFMKRSKRRQWPSRRSPTVTPTPVKLSPPTSTEVDADPDSQSRRLILARIIGANPAGARPHSPARPRLMRRRPRVCAICGRRTCDS
jgi:hypothetical protein